ncbi:MAG: preprotein translocase subunit SecE [Thermoanaerobaculia bacterium]
MNLTQRWTNFRDFLADVKKEAGKVSWPGKSEVMGTTTVVIIYTAMVGVFLALIDMAISPVMDQLLKLGRG